MKKALKWLIPLIAAVAVVGVVSIALYLSTLNPEPGSGNENDTHNDTDWDTDIESESDTGYEDDTDVEHVFDEGIVTKEPTCYEEGILLRTCTVCGFQMEEVIDKIETAYVITVEGFGEYLIPESGEYKLEDPVKVGFEFIKWLDAKGNEFPKEGKISESIVLIPEFKLLDTTTVEELAERAEGGAEIIRIVNDIVIDRPIFVTSTTKIYSEKPVKLIRASGYLGDMFVIGQDSAGENSILMNLTPALVLGDESYTGSEILLTIDGNRNGMKEGSEVVGTALFLLNSARVDMYNGVSISNHQKLGNERILNVSKYQIGTSKTIGGAAVMISSGSAFYMHGGIMDNNSGRVQALVLEDGTSSIPSGYGGAVYNNGTFRMSGGAITNCSANRGGAIYSDTITEITGGILEGNYAENKGGAICTSGSGGADTFIGVKDAAIGTVIFRNNSAGKQGGAILSYFNSPLLLFGGVLFEGNSAIGTSGGAISTSGPITSYGNSFVNNTAKSNGGAIYQTYAGTDYVLRIVEINDTSFEGNSANNGGAIYVASEFKALDCEFTNNKAKTGGAVSIVRSSTLINCTFTNNSASYRGGAIYVPYTKDLTNMLKATIEGSKFISNKATEGGDDEERRGGAIYVGEYNFINIKGSEFENNTATQYGGAISGARGSVIDVLASKITGSNATNGGAIWAYSDSTLNISGSEIKNNSAQKDGGAIYSYNTVNASETAFEGNTANNGGAIMIANGATSTEKCTFTANIAKLGGAVYISAGIYNDGTEGVEFSGSTFTSNSAYRGGAIYATNDEEQTNINKFTVNHSTFKSNKATEGGSDDKRRGGAIYVAEYITATVNNSIFEENTATQYSGAINVARGSVLYVNNSEFIKNASETNGGAIWIYLDSTANISGSKFTENTSAGNGGALYSYNIANVLNTEFTKNTATNGGAICVAGGTTSIAGSAFDSNTAGTYGGAVYVTEDTVLLDGYDEKAGSTFNKNTAAYGGAIYLANVDDPTANPNREAGKAFLNGSAFVGNAASKTGGAIFANIGAELKTEAASFTENTATAGGAIKISGGSYSYVDNDSQFDKNIATDGEGGAIHSQGSINLTNTAFDNNKVEASGKRGGAIYLTSGAIQAEGVSFENNIATGNGGAIVLTAAGSSSFTSCNFTGNKSSQRGGAIYATNTEIKTISCEFDENSAVERGGAVYTTTSGIYIDGDQSIANSGSRFRGNSAPEGGALFADKTATLYGTVFENNSAVATEEGVTSKGGAIASDYGTITLTETSFTGNTADLGGAIFDGKRLNLVISGATVTQNSSGIAISGGAISVSGNVIIKDNGDYDVSLAKDKLITIAGALDDTAKIGFTTVPDATEFVKADGETITDISAYVDRFFNNDGNPIFIDGNGKVICGMIISEQPSATNGYTVSTDWQPTSYTWYFWTGDAKGDVVEGQTTATLTNGIDNMSYVCVLAFGDKTVETQPVTVIPEIVLQNHPICGANCTCGDVNHNALEWFPVSDLAGLISAAATEGNYYLTEDILIDSTVTFSANVNLCLNGKKISRSGEAAFTMISVADNATLTITDCSNDERVGYIDPETSLWTEGAYSGEGTATEYKLYGGLITNGAGAGGQAINASGTLNTYGINFAGNTASDSGSAIYTTGDYNDVGSTFVGNTSTKQGGAVQLGGNTVLKNTVFTNNRSTGNRAGAMLITGGAVNAYGVTFKNNIANGNGGAVVITGADGQSVFDNCLFEGNQSLGGDGRGGAMYLYKSGLTTTLSCTFKNNLGTVGGAIYVTSSAPYTDGVEGGSRGSSFTGNESSGAGGALYIVGTVNLWKTKIESNTASTEGGAIYVAGGVVSLQNTTVTSNNSGVYLNKGTLNVSGNVVINNNTEYNAFLAKNMFITVAGALDSDAKIGVTITTEVGVFAKADGENVTGISEYTDRFFADNGDVVFVDANGNLAYGFIIEEEPSAFNGYTVATSTVPDSYTWYLWVDNAKGAVVDGQNTATLTNGVANQSYVCVITLNGKTIETQPVTVVPTVTLQNHPICGSNCECSDTTHESLEWYPISTLDDLIAASATEGNYYLTDDIVIDSTVTFSANVNLCLNGKKISRSGDTGFAMISVAADVTLTITDCSERERAGYIDPETGLWSEGTYGGEGTATEYKLYGGLITNGAGAGGSAITVNGTLNTYGINFAGNITSASGGAVLVNGKYSDVGSTFVGNIGYRGGAITVSYDANNKNALRLTVKGSTFTFNGATSGGSDTKRRGGAIHIAEDIIASIINSTFEGNSATQYGGAISVANRSQLVVTGSTFNKNSSGTNGGAIWLYSNTSISVSGGEFKENSTGSNGGAIYTYNTVELTGVKFTSNTADNGGAIYTMGTANVTESTFIRNSAATNGGAILNIGGNATLISCIFDSNTAGSRGGAIMSTSEEKEVDGKTYYIPSTLTMIGGEIKNGVVDTNWSSNGSYGGGLMVNLGSQATLEGVTFDNNKAYSGGAITSYGSATVLSSDGTEQKVYTNITLNNVTLTNNDGQNGAVYVGGAGQMTVNDLVATNNTSTGSAAVFYLTSASSILTVNSATISGNTGKGSLGFIQTANSANTLNIYKAGITGSDVNDNWDVLIKKGAASTVNELTAPSTEQ